MNKKFLLLGIILILFSSFASASLTTDLTSYYKFDTDADDSLGINNPTENSASLTTGSGGLINEAYEFDGGTAKIGFSTMIDNLSAFSFSGWIKQDVATPTASYVWSEDRGTSGDNDLQVITSTGKLYWRLTTEDTVEATPISNSVINTNTWYHVVLTYDGTTAKMYIDNVLQTTTASATGDVNSGADMRVGVWKDEDGNRGWDGLADEFGWWSRALTASEVTDLYNSGSGLKYPFPADEFVITATDVYTSESILNFTANITGEGSLSTTNGTINTGLYKNATSTYNIIVYKTNYFQESFPTYNVSSNLNVDLTGSQVEIRAFSKITETQLTNWTLEHNQGNEVVSSGVATIFPISNKNYLWNLTSIQGDYYNIFNEAFTIPSLFNGTKNFTGVYNNILNITANNAFSDEAIQNFSGYVYNSANSFNESFSTLNGSVFVNLEQGLTYEVYLEGSGYVISNETNNKNITINNTTQDLNFELYTKNSILINFRDELTNELINGTIDIELISIVESQTHNTTTSSFNISLLSPVEWLIRYSSTNYTHRTYYFNLVNNTFTNLTLYLVNTTQTDRISVTVFDEYNYRVSDAYIKVLHYDVATNAYLVTEVLKTDSNGENYFDAILEDDFYKFIVEKPIGRIVFTSTPSVLTSTTLTLQVNLGETFATTYFNFLDVSYTLTFNNATNNFVYTYSDANNIMESACLKVYELNQIGETLYDSSCASGSSNTLTVNIDNSSGNSYRADTYFNFGDENLFVISLYHDFIEKLEGGGLGVFLIALLTIVFMSTGLWNPTAAILLTPLPLLLASIIGFVSISVGITIPLMVLAMIVAYVINRG